MRSLGPLLLAALTLVARGQSRPDCPTRPATLAAMRGCYRPLLVFAPSASDPRLARQRAILDHAADDMMDRNVLFLPIPAPQTPPLDAPYTLPTAGEVAALRRRFRVSPTVFTVILVGEDGNEKLRASTPVSIEKLNSLIDAMPTRKREMQQPHTN